MAIRLGRFGRAFRTVNPASLTSYQVTHVLDLKFIRENSDLVKKAAADKGEKVDVDRLLALDADRRRIIARVEELRRERNDTSKQVNELRKAGQDTTALVERVRHVGQETKTLEGELAGIEDELQGLCLAVPNVPAPDVPVGPDASTNEVVRVWGTRREFDFEALPHWELGARLGILDFPRAAKLSGSGFTLYMGSGARLERALFNFMLDYHTKHHNYKEVFPPFLVTRECMTGTGQLPKLEEDMYRTTEDDLFLIPTAEVPVTNMHRDEVLSHDVLPLYYTAYTACFRREAGSYGKDTRGMIRVHQFNKVEMVKFVEPSTSYDELERLVADAEEILQQLGLEYRVVKLSTGDLSFAASKCYDLEAWAPGVEKWLEVSSCSNFESFQARRVNVRYRDAKGRLLYVHTLNGSGLALPRVFIAVLESYQRADGAVAVPKALVPYMDGAEVIQTQARAT